MLDRVPGFKERLEWFLNNRPELAELVSRWQVEGVGNRHLLSLTRGHRTKRLLARALDTSEFLSEHGIRSVSKYHETHPYVLHVDGADYVVHYEPAESQSSLFGGNSNWRGPVWFPINYLMIESLRRFHHYYGGDFRIEHPTGSGILCTFDEIADDLSQRLIALFERDSTGQRPCNGSYQQRDHDPLWNNYVLFHEYFHGDNGSGLGAAHQTGWTGLVATLIQEQGKRLELQSVKGEDHRGKSDGMDGSLS
jgi:hypothetical protein